jgi:hypothetical protein
MERKCRHKMGEDTTEDSIELDSRLEGRTCKRKNKEALERDSRAGTDIKRLIL